MPTVTCPSCGEKGRIPANFIGTRIKCRKCGVGFLVGASAAKPAAPGQPPAAAPHAPAPVVTKRGDGNEIEVEGLDDAAWSATAVATVEHGHDHEHDHAHDPSTAAFTPHHDEAEHPATRQYKILTPRDKYFEGKFDLEKLEAALNHFSRQGWVVRGMATPHVTGFHGEREELVVLLERG